MTTESTTTDERFVRLERAMRTSEVPPVDEQAVFRLRDVAVSYAGVPAVEGVTLDVPDRAVTALIGPSGCGKSTLLRCLDRMNDLIAGAAVTGLVEYRGIDLYARDVDPVLVRRSIGMVFQKPNPFPKSIRENVVFALRVAGLTDDVDGRVERALRAAALWDEVKDDLKRSALTLSGGQQQRLCIARALASDPHGRAVFSARSDRDRAYRGPAARATRALRDRHRHAQHAAGDPRQRPYCLLHHRSR